MKTAQDKLRLYEEVMLLALRDKEGTLVGGTHYRFALAAMIMTELLLEERIRLNEETRAKKVEVVDRSRLQDEILDEALEKMVESKRQRPLQYWVSKVSNHNDLRDRVAGRLCERGILRADRDKVLLIFTRKVFPEVDPGPERRIVERLRKAVLVSPTSVDPHTVALLSVIKATNLLKTVFSSQEIRSHKKDIERMIAGESCGKAAKDAIQATQAVIIATTTAATIAATTTAT